MGTLSNNIIAGYGMLRLQYLYHLYYRSVHHHWLSQNDIGSLTCKYRHVERYLMGVRTFMTGIEKIRFL
jgi:hypothetical protein